METKETYIKKYGSFKYLECYKTEVSFFGYQFNYLMTILKFNQFNQKTCLDVGCGFGLKTYYLAHNFYRVLGVDIAENIINVNKLLNDKENLDFQTYEFNLNEKLSSSFDVITAFGFSLLNTKFKDEYIKCVKHLLDHTNESGKLIIWSSTDFSGNLINGWYNHTKSELNQLYIEIRIIYKDVRLKYCYDHFKISELFSIEGLKIILRYFSRKKYYFFVIEK